MRLRQAIVSLVTVLFFLFILWMSHQADIGRDHFLFRATQHIAYGDKWAHFFLYGILAYLLNASLLYRRIPLGRRLVTRDSKAERGEPSVYLGTLLVLVVVSVDEVSQDYIATRTMDEVDYMANVCGIFLFSALQFFFRRYKRQGTPED